MSRVPDADPRELRSDAHVDDVIDVVDQLTGVLLDAVDGSAAAVLLLDDESFEYDWFRVAVRDDERNVVGRVDRPAIAASSLAAVEQAALVDDLLSRPDLHLLHEVLGVRAAVMAPIVVDGDALGMAVAGFTLPGAATSHDARVVTGIAGAMGSAFRSAITAQLGDLLTAPRSAGAEIQLAQILAVVNLRAGLLRLVADPDLVDELVDISALSQRGIDLLGRDVPDLLALIESLDDV